MAYEALTYERRDDVALITLNRPERLNALNVTLQHEVVAAFAEARNDDGVRAVVITGAGRGFCSGADIAGLADESQTPLGVPRTNTQNDLIDDLRWVGR